MRSSLPWILLALWTLACDDGGDAGPVGDAAAGDDSAVADGSASPDATPDAAPRDAMPQDAAPADAAPRDAAPDAAPPDAAELDAAPPDAAPMVDATPDAAPPLDATPLPEGLCAACSEDDDCAALGDGAACTGLIPDARYCAPACQGDGPGACPPGFGCVFGLCQPAGGRCDSCATMGCPADQRCNGITGLCEPRAGRCAGCQGDGDCQQGLLCRPVGFLGRNCLPPCDAGCPDGFRCEGGACKPASGFCDPCGGCGGERPVCDFIRRECVECGGATPCPEGRICDEQGACVEPPAGVDCNTELDCRDAERPLCVDRRCVQCRDDARCGPREACVEGTCQPQGPCDRLACQQGSACDPETGRCAPGCQADEECGDERRCNPETGQCYRADQRCDGEETVCAPGGECRPDPFDMNRRICTCAKTNPDDLFEPNEAHRVPCQPGGVCLQIGRETGACVPAP